WRRGDERLQIRRACPPVLASARRTRSSPADTSSGPAVTVATAPIAVAAPEVSPAPAVEKAGFVVTSPFVGTFYRSPSPDQLPFVEVGSLVRKGQILCI